MHACVHDHWVRVSYDRNVGSHLPEQVGGKEPCPCPVCPCLRPHSCGHSLGAASSSLSPQQPQPRHWQRISLNAAWGGGSRELKGQNNCFDKEGSIEAYIPFFLPMVFPEPFLSWTLRKSLHLTGTPANPPPLPGHH